MNNNKIENNYRVILIFLLFVFPFSIYSQRSEFKIQYRIGTPLSNSQTLDLLLKMKDSIIMILEV